ncbi:MAG: carboxypeptidase-like regulatory domain-containing protein [Blastochloris sp.]|nr:carboxypeptidase-like regulatory domain-containing protein [Blastochloris sp.]
MNRQRIIFIGLIIICVLLVILWLWPKPKQSSHNDVTHSSTQPASSSSSVATTQSNQIVPLAASKTPEQAQLDKRKDSINSIVAAFHTSISFYGKVIDQNGNPVPQAKIGYNAADKFMASGSSYKGQSDENGYFSITGIKGFRLGVTVRKEGYYFIDGKSSHGFAYGSGSDGVFLEPPTKDNPAVFVLQKMGDTEPLIANSNSGVQISRYGTPLTLDLTTGRISSNGQIKVEVWTEDLNASLGQHYNWKCRISIPGGGLVERKDQFDFEAPETGYRAADEIVVFANSEQWSPDAVRNYFLKLSNGAYARIEFTMIAQGNHYFKIESYLNPKVGSRNLEYDPAKVIKP